jgi:hypothetical protein
MAIFGMIGSSRFLSPISNSKSSFCWKFKCPNEIKLREMQSNRIQSRKIKQVFFIPNSRDLAALCEDGIRHYSFDGLLYSSGYSPISPGKYPRAFDDFGANVLPCRQWVLRHRRARCLRAIRRVVVHSPKSTGMSFWNPENPPVERLESIHAPWGTKNSSIPLQCCGGPCDNGAMSGVSVKDKKSCSSWISVLPESLKVSIHHIRCCPPGLRCGSPHFRRKTERG